MKTIMKTIIIAIVAMAMCTASMYADWFGLGSITDDDDLPEVYHDHDHDGRGLMPNMEGDPAGIDAAIEKAKNADKENEERLNAKETLIKSEDSVNDNIMNDKAQKARSYNDKQNSAMDDWAKRAKAARISRKK